LIRKHLHGLMEVKQRSHFEKFVSRLVATQLDAGSQKRVNEAFRAFDTNKDGVISKDEFRRSFATPQQPAVYQSSHSRGRVGGRGVRHLGDALVQEDVRRQHLQTGAVRQPEGGPC